MLTVILTAAAATAGLDGCMTDAAIAPRRAIATATHAKRADPVAAGQCEGMAYATLKDWARAQAAFEAAAVAAEAARDGRGAYLWVQAGNAALAGGAAPAALVALDRAVARGLTGEMLGEALIDRARARAALGDQQGARTDLDRALTLVPDAAYAWLLSATLARRMGALTGAEHDIAEALARAPDDPAIAYEAGNIAAAAGAMAAARTAWEAAVRNGPDTDAGRAARKRLATEATAR